MPRSIDQLRRDALAIWRAGVEAVRSDRLVRAAVRVEGGRLFVADESLELDLLDRIAVVGGGKAGAAMALGLEHALGEAVLVGKKVFGWVNVPDGNLPPTRAIHLHPARPRGVNEPTQLAQNGAEKILELVGSLGPRDLCLVLLSGGASALLPAPAEGLSLDDKIALTRFLSAAGATIEELNCVRAPLSRIKGGGLARACRAGALVSLVISDVLGDRLDVIASGPTVTPRSGPTEALEVLSRFGARGAGLPEGIFQFLQNPALPPAPPTANVRNVVIGNCAMAVDAAALAAERLGYAHAAHCAAQSEGSAESVGERLAAMGRRMRSTSGPDCLVSGGEPVVALAPPGVRGRGGRNQQLALAAGIALDGADGVLVLSAGTDGEDGPTDAAGALVDAPLLQQAAHRGLDLADHLQRNDAYPLFDQLGGLIRSGATDTNVGDLRVVLVDRIERSDGPSAPIG